MKKVFSSNVCQVLYRNYPIVCSIDMHENSSYVYTVDTTTGEILTDCNIIGKVSVLVNYIKKHYEAYKSKLVILYEAGPLGFSPYRSITRAGYTCRIIAPSSIPRQSKRQKTDRRDAIDNLQYFIAGSLRFVTVPDEYCEQARECLRYRYELNYRVTKQKQRILSVLKRNGCEFTGTKSNWTKTHYAYLHSVALPDITRRLLDIELEHLDYYKTQLTEIDKILDEFFRSTPTLHQLFELFQCVAGIGRVGAMTLVLEVGDLSRFYHPAALMNFLGLVPKKYSSGTSDPALHITKTGNKYARLVLVAASRSYRDRRLLCKKKVIDQLAPPLQLFIKRMQNRLATRYSNLRKNKKHGNKAKCAVARELCGFLWELITVVHPQIIDLGVVTKKAA